jgi:hypothetical protein
MEFADLFTPFHAENPVLPCIGVGLFALDGSMEKT